MLKNSSILAVSVIIKLSTKLGFVSVNGLRETYFVDVLCNMLHCTGHKYLHHVRINFSSCNYKLCAPEIGYYLACSACIANGMDRSAFTIEVGGTLCYMKTTGMLYDSGKFSDTPHIPAVYQISVDSKH